MKRFSDFVGIDVSKLTLDIVLHRTELGNKSPHLRTTNSLDGIGAIFKWLSEYSVKPEGILFCMEHTGIYCNKLRALLDKKGMNYCLISPLHMKRSMGLVRGKNDKVDAFHIARYGYAHQDEISCTLPINHTIETLKHLLTERQRLVRLKAVSKAYVDEKENHKMKPSLMRARVMIDMYNSMIKEIESEIESLLVSDSEMANKYDLTQSVIGIGKVTAAMIIAYTNNFTSINNARKFAAYCGVAPYPHTSGTSIRGKTRVSHMANKKVKGVLSNGARAAVQHDPELKKYYERKIGEGKQYGVVMNAVKFKMINRVFATVNRGTPYVKLRNAG